MSDGLLIVLIVLAIIIISRFVKRRRLVSSIHSYVNDWKTLCPEEYKSLGKDYEDLTGFTIKELENTLHSCMSLNTELWEKAERKAEWQHKVMVTSSAFQSWYDNQQEFYKKCCKIRPQSFGRATKIIDIEGIGQDGKKITKSFPVCQLVAHWIPPKDYLNYYLNEAPTGFPNEYPLFYEPFHNSFIRALSLGDDISGEHNSLSQSESTSILNIIDSLASDKTAVLFIDKYHENIADFNNRVYSIILEQLHDRKIKCLTLKDIEEDPFLITHTNIIIIELISLIDEIKSNCLSLFCYDIQSFSKKWSAYSLPIGRGDFSVYSIPYTSVSLAYISVYNEMPISFVAKQMDIQTQKDKGLLNRLLKEGTLISISPYWTKTGIVRLFLTQEPNRHCLILTLSTWHAKRWENALFDIGIDKKTYTVARYSDYEEYDDTNYDLLVFDGAEKLELGKRAEICKRLDAEYVLTLGSVSDEDEELMKKAQMPKRLRACAFSWDYVPQSVLRHSFFIRYYPTSLQDFEATDEEWKDRKFIWYFKNNPDKRTQYTPILHEHALNKAIEMLEERLNQTFGELLTELTLVCIPASSPSKNEARYKEFSERLCESTGMSNAYTHITVTEDTLGRHEGGVGGDVNTIVFDWDYFYGRYLLLFDDVLTTGSSMRQYAKLFASHGSEVIACLSLGKTFHHRESEEPEEQVVSFD